MERFRSLILCIILVVFATANYAQPIRKRQPTVRKTVTHKNYYALAIKAIKANNLAELDANIKHIGNIDSLIAADNYHAYTLLGYALLYKNKTATQKLIEKKADIGCVCSDDVFTFDALYMAINNADMNLVKQLLALGTNPNQPYNEDGLCPLMMCCDLNNVPMASLLLESGAKADGVGNLGGDNVSFPLIVAVEKKNTNMVQLLLKHGAKRNVKNNTGQTPISIARSQKLVKIVKMLEKR